MPNLIKKLELTVSYIRHSRLKPRIYSTLRRENGEQVTKIGPVLVV